MNVNPLTPKMISALSLVAMVSQSASAGAQVFGVREAESTTITAVAYKDPIHILWASGKYIAPPRWGSAAGDRLEFDITLDTYQENLQLGVRYSYEKDSHLTQVKNPGPRELQLIIDNNQTVPVPVPDTHGWNHFQVADIILPPLQPGYHTFALVAPANFCETNIDTFIFHKGAYPDYSNGLLRPTRLVDPGKGIILCGSVDAKLLEAPEKTHASLQALFELMSQDFAKSIDHRVFFHLTDKSRWWNTKARIVQNRYGVYVLADGRPYDRSEWCWALANYFVQGSGVPAWFSNSSSRVVGWMDWLPSLPDSASDHETQVAAEAGAEAQEFLQNPDSKCSRAEVVQLAVRLKYGNDIFKKFWQKIADARKADPTPKSYDKNETIALLSQAAGEDVLPLYQRWTGFKSEGPVDPLILVFQAKD